MVTTQNRDEEFVTWGTDRGYLYVGRIDRRSEDSFVSNYRLTTNGTFSSPPAYLPPDPKVLGDSDVIYAGSSDGYVYAVLERSGELQWKFATSDPVIDSPVVIEDRVYATTELGGMFCLNAKTGKQIWWAPEVLHFVAAGKQRVYAADKLGRLRILDARNGGTARHPAHQRHADQGQQWPDRPDLPGHGRGNHPVLARNGTDQSRRLRRRPQGGDRGEFV